MKSVGNDNDGDGDDNNGDDNIGTSDGATGNDNNGNDDDVGVGCSRQRLMGAAVTDGRSTQQSAYRLSSAMYS